MNKLLIITLLLLFSCQKHVNPMLIHTPIPPEIRNPKIDKMDRGFYPCGSKVEIDGKEENAFRCMSFKDYKTHALNDYRLEQAHQSLVEIIDSMNLYYESFNKKKGN